MWKILLAGSALPLAFSPFNYYPVAIISLLVLLNEWLYANPKRAFMIGWLFGLGFFGVGISWVFVSIHKYGNTNILLALLITILFVVLLALFLAIQGLIISWLYKFKPKTYLLIAFPTSWVLIEHLRCWLFTGFPWLYLGYSQLNTPLAGFAPIIGVYGISFAVAFSASLIMLILKKYYSSTTRNSITKTLAILMLIIIWTVGYKLQSIPWANREPNPLTVSLIQGNLTPNDKFLLANPIQTTTEVYLTPTTQHLVSNFIIWPENSLPLPLLTAKSFLASLDKLAKQHKTTLLLGLPAETLITSNQYYNALLALGEGQGIYYKKRLVPFGEYLPLEQWLRGLINFFDIPMSNFKPGPAQQTPLVTPNSKLLPLICYEIAYPEQVRRSLLEQQSNAIITISEDGWFGKSLGPHQHLDIARMRALENGRYVIRSTTSGISAIINDKGAILKQSPQFEPYVLTGEFFNITGNTPWTKYGQFPVLLCCALLFILYPIYKILH